MSYSDSDCGRPEPPYILLKLYYMYISVREIDDKVLPSLTGIEYPPKGDKKTCTYI